MNASSSTTRADRVLKLLLYLWEQGSISTAEAARLLDTERRTALRDIKLLTEHIALRASGAGRARRWILDPSMRIKNLNVLDRFALELGRETTRFLKGSGLHEGLARIAPDQLASLPPHFRQNLDRKIRLQAEPHRSYIKSRDIVEDVLDGLLRERLLDIVYQRADGTVRVHTGMMPLTLVLYRRAMYLMVRRPEDGRTFTMAIERIQNITILDAFAYPADWNPDTALSNYFGMVRSGEPERVVLRFDPRMAIFVRARVWHATQVIRELPDGRIELEMNTAGKELVRMVLEWGPNCEVVEPRALREAVIDSIRRSAHLYGLQSSAEE